MKLRKLISGVAALAVATTAFATSASASLVVVETPDAGLSTGTGSWLVQLYNTGNPDENKPAVDYGIAKDVAKIEFTFETTEPDWFEGGCGGAITFSCNGGDIGLEGDLFDTYNWVAKEWWGVTDGEIATSATDKPAVTETVAPGKYKVAVDVVNPLVNGDAAEIGCMQIALQEWGQEVDPLKVTGATVYDASGNVLMTFDANGKPSKANISTGGDGSEGEGGNTGAGDVDGETDGGKDSPDTGIEDVAVVAGLAIVAAGAIAISRKRK